MEEAPSARFVLSPLSQWLTAGDDERLIIDPESGRNRYGCPALPDPQLCALGSSTASPISPAALLAAEALLHQLQSDLITAPAEAVYARESARIGHELRTLCQLDDLPGLTVALTASGTEAHQTAARLLALNCGSPLSILTVAAEETGSGIIAAVAPHAATTSTVALRLANGTPRDAADIDADFTRLAEQSIAAGQHLLLVLADVSKSGLIAPSPAQAAELHRRWPGRCDILVDACQFRLPGFALRQYLEQGFTVAITGSKFFGGPSFSGALLTPATGQPPSTDSRPPNFGLLLRWQAALSEMRAFHAICNDDIKLFFNELSHSLQVRLEQSPVCTQLPPGTLTRLPHTATSPWDSTAGIFPLRLRHPDSGTALTPEATRQVYHLMQQDLRGFFSGATSDVAAVRFLLGQPVLCGTQDSIPLSALRLCISARMVATAAASPETRRQLIARALSAIDKIELIVAAHLVA